MLVDWVRKALATTGNSPSLEHVYNSGDALIACDGFRLHAARCKVVLDSLEFPSGEPRVDVMVDAKCLIEACEVALGAKERWVHLRFYEDGSPFEVFAEVGGNKYYALVMPMMPSSHSGVELWRPTLGKKKVDDDVLDPAGA